jgi:hypothetical protein
MQSDTALLLDALAHAEPDDRGGTKSYSRREKALHILVARKEPAALDAVLGIVRDCGENPMCERAIGVLENSWRDDRAIDALLEAAETAEEPKAITVLGSYVPASRDALIRLLRHEGADVRLRASRALAYSSGPHGNYKGREDTVVLEAAESAMSGGSLEVAAVFYQQFLGPQYKGLILAAFDRYPGEESFNALCTTYIHHNPGARPIALTTKEMICTGGRPDNSELRARLEEILDDPEKRNFRQ